MFLKLNSTLYSNSSLIDDCQQLLNVLTNGATGRNPTFFKAYGHEDVFGLKSCIPEGGTTMEVVEDVPCEDGFGQPSEENVLYVRLPEGHPFITAEAPSQPEYEPPSNESSEDQFNIEEAIEQAELIFQDDSNEFEDSTNADVSIDKEMSEIDPCFQVPELLTIDEVAAAEAKNGEISAGIKRTSPRNMTKKLTEIISTPAAMTSVASASKTIKPVVTDAVIFSVNEDAGLAEASLKVKFIGSC